MRITITEKTGAKTVLFLRPTRDQDYKIVNCRYYTGGGYYNAANSWEDRIAVDDIERQLEYARLHSKVFIEVC